MPQQPRLPSSSLFYLAFCRLKLKLVFLLFLDQPLHQPTIVIFVIAFGVDGLPTNYSEEGVASMNAGLLEINDLVCNCSKSSEIWTEICVLEKNPSGRTEEPRRVGRGRARRGRRPRRGRRELARGRKQRIWKIVGNEATLY